jgi:hypothetical protein
MELPTCSVSVTRREDGDCGEFPVDGGDQAESQRRVELENEKEGGCERPFGATAPLVAGLDAGAKGHEPVRAE